MDNKITEDKLHKFFESSFWMVNKYVLRCLGASTAIWIADMLAKWNYFKERELVDEDGFFYNTQTNIEQDTGISLDTQQKITHRLASLGILEIKRQGIPARNYYKLNIKTLIDYCVTEMNTEKSNDITSYRKTPRQVSEKLLDKYPQNSDTIIKDNKLKDNKLENELLHFPNTTDRSISKRNSLSFSGENGLFFNLPKPIQTIIDNWKNLGFKVPNEDTKAFGLTTTAIRHLLTGREFTNIEGLEQYWNRSFTLQEIISVVFDFHLATTHDPAYRNKTKNIYFHQFVHNPFNKAIGVSASLFLYHLENKDACPLYKHKVAEDTNPEITSLLIKQYEKVTACMFATMTIPQQNKFTVAATKLLQFCKDNETRFLCVMSMDILVTELMQALTDHYSSGRVLEPGNLCSAYTFTRILPQHLVKTGYFKEL